MIRHTILASIVFGIAMSSFAAEPKAKATTSRDEDAIGRKVSERIGPYRQTPPLSFTKAETRDTWLKEYERLTVDEKVHYCVFQLRNEQWSESFRPWSDEPYSKNPEQTASRELIKLGRSAIPQLLRVLDSRVSTHVYPTRHRGDPWLVRDAAMDAIDNIACRYFGDDWVLYELSDRDEKERGKICKKVAAWWEQNKGSDEVQWAKDSLLCETTAHGESRGMAIDSLYRRLGKKSYPFLVKAYHRLPKGRENADDETTDNKVQILQRLLKAPTNNEKAVFASAVHDAPLWVRIDGAEGLWAIGDSSGLEIMVKEVEQKLTKEQGSGDHFCGYLNLMSFLGRCNTRDSREAIYKCLLGSNPYLRGRAIGEVPTLRMEKAVRALPELFDDPFVLGGSYTRYDGKTETTVPPRRVCDEAAEAFTKVVPDAPRYVGTTEAEQKTSIDKLKQWWKENGSKLKWDEKKGMLVRPATK